MALPGATPRGANLDGVAAASEEALLVIRNNLLDGLSRVAEHLEAGTFDVVGERGKAPPSQSGWLTLVLLGAVNERLEALGHRTIFREE